jgi:5S rRNA maturation endonuclease (ribonuclease M5)
MIPAKEFAPAADSLVIGEQTRINHDNCKAGVDTRGRLYVKRDQHAVLAYCHNCGDYGIASRGPKIKNIKDLLVENEQLAQVNGRGELVLPPDIVYTRGAMPLGAWGWLEQYITWAEVVDNEIGYSPSWDRVILPVYEDGKLVYWQGRALRKDTEKYISAKAHPKVMAWKIGNLPTGGDDKLIIVEDYLSAIKVSRYCDAVALLGTSPDIDCLSERLHNYKSVGVLLDPDMAGINKAYELAKRLSLVARGNVVQLTAATEATCKQPKEMSDEMLKGIVSGLRSTPGS